MRKSEGGIFSSGHKLFTTMQKSIGSNKWTEHHFHKELFSQLTGNPIAEESIWGYLARRDLKRMAKVLLGFIVCKKYKMIDKM
jgi:hypothetical protein